MKNKKLKQTKRLSEDANEIRNLIIITIIIVLFTAGLYFLTDASLAKKKNQNEEVSVAEISYDEITIGMMFSRPYNEYYIFAFKSDDKSANQYETLVSNYKSNEDAKKIYSIDLNLKFNSFVLSETVNKAPEKATDVKIKDKALFLIKNGKVLKYYETTSEIEKALS